MLNSPGTEVATPAGVAPVVSPNRTGKSDGSKRRVRLYRRSGWQPVNFSEVWNYRELLWILALRDIRVRYKQTALGASWAILQPFLTMLVFTIIFARLGNLPTDGIQPQLFYFAALLPWQLFANSLTQAGNSLVGNQNLITKVYFPRLVIPISAVVTGLIDFAIALVVLAGMMAWYGVAPAPQVVLFPIFVGLGFLASVGIGLWLSALNVEFRDVRYVIPFLTQFWLFITPIAYPSSIVPQGWKRVLLGLNPMSGVVEGFRWCVFGKPMPGPMLAVSVITIFLVLVGGLFYFRRMEKSFADVV